MMNLQKENKVLNKQEEVKKDKVNDINLGKFTSAKSISKSRVAAEPGVISIINSESGGRRITLSRALMENLKNPDCVQFAFADKSIAIGEKLPDNDNYFYIKKDESKEKSKGIIYAGLLVKEITEELELDFTDKSSITLYDVEYISFQKYPVAIIKE